MKRKLFFVILLLTFAPLAFAQSVVITPKKVVYKRPKPVEDYKKSFTVIYPKVKGVSAALARKIESAISYEKVFELNIDEEINEIQWLYEAFYKVNYNKFGILDITLTVSGSGAYPEEMSKTVVVDLKTGARVKAADIFTNLEKLAATVKKMQQAEMKKANAEYKRDPNAENFDSTEYFREVDFKTENLDEFTVSAKGVTFIYDYDFPHVVRALQPDGRYFLSWTALKPYIKRGGLLARFVR
jgi:hypothetical protein